MTTKTAKGKITGLLALTMEASVATDIGDAVQISGDYEVEIADGTLPVLGYVSVSNKGRVSTSMGTSVGNAVVPGAVTVEARGFMVRTLVAGAAITAGVFVGIDSSGDLVADPEDGSVMQVGIALMAAAQATDPIDVLIR